MVRGAPLETEIKLSLPDKVAYDKLRAILSPPLRVVLQENLFFDGPCGELRSLRAALRLRREVELRTGTESTRDSNVRLDAGSTGGPGSLRDTRFWIDEGKARYFLTLKTRGTISGSVHSRQEIEVELATGPLLPFADPSALLALDLEPVRALRGMAPEIVRLTDQGGFLNLRECFRPRSEVVPLLNTLWELDLTEFPGGTVDYELEVELRHTGEGSLGEEQAGEELLNLLESWGVPASPQRMSKYERFLLYRTDSPGAGDLIHG